MKAKSDLHPTGFYDWTPCGDVRCVWGLALGYWLIASALACWLYPVTMSDPISRYAPMANAFAAGDWGLAFHPRFGVLFQSVSGSIAWLTGLDGAHAIQITSFLFLSLSIVPLWLLVRRLFGLEVAWWTVLLVLFMDRYASNASDGLRDNGKCLAFALIGWGVVSRKSFWLGLGLFILTTLVSYGFAIASVVLFGWCVWSLLKRDLAALPLPVAGWTLGTVAVSFMVHAFTGYWMPAPSFVKIVGG